jgi:hypothetical protein
MPAVWYPALTWIVMAVASVFVLPVIAGVILIVGSVAEYARMVRP